MKEKDSIIQVSLHIRDNKIKIRSMSNQKICLASLVSQTKYFRIIASFMKKWNFVLYSDYLTCPNLIICFLFITHGIDMYI